MISLIISASSFIVISFPAPIFTKSPISLKLFLFIKYIAASAKSSTYKNSLLGAPVPHNSTEGRLFNFASWNLLIKAGITWPVSKSKLSLGPNRFVGITEIKLVTFLLLNYGEQAHQEGN